MSAAAREALVSSWLSEPKTPSCGKASSNRFWVVDNGSSHRGREAADRLSAAFPNAILVHTPVHASWLNQIEIFFSVVFAPPGP
ncbi:transposase [Streptomyces niveus]|uniref:transposase n=1 Tax=Streptomyces niveus TaxID=193462 RepID=UPI0036D3D21B